MKKQARKIKATKRKPIFKKKLKKAVQAVKAVFRAKGAPKVKAPLKEVKKRKARAGVVPDVERPVKTLKFSKEDVAKFKKLLLDLRDYIIDGVNFLATDNLKRSQRDAAGELSGYGLHMADAGTDTFDREFALSLVSNEQEALYEIEEALKRFDQNTYGVCGMCEKTIAKARLEAVPFARLCVDCQSNVEKNSHRPGPQGPTFTESADDEGGETEESEQ